MDVRAILITHKSCSVQMPNVHRYTPWWQISLCEVRPVMAQNAVNRHESTYRRAAPVMTLYPALYPHDAFSYGYDIFCSVFPS